MRVPIRLAAVLAAGLVLEAQTLTLDEVLFRANEAVAGYERLLSRAVTEERYTQRIVRADGSLERERTMVSELVLVRLPAEESWRGFRDVLEIDGQPVRERDGRLAALLADSSQGALDQAEQINQQSRKHYLRDVWRRLDLSVVGLTFLHALNQHRFYFEQGGEEVVDGIRAWTIRFSEHARPSLLSMDVNVFARGTLWIDPATGSLAKSDITVGDQNTPLRSSVSTTFRRDEHLGVWVPAEMNEVHDSPRLPKSDRAEGRATYGAFRALGQDSGSR